MGTQIDGVAAAGPGRPPSRLAVTGDASAGVVPVRLSGRCHTINPLGARL